MILLCGACACDPACSAAKATTCSTPNSPRPGQPPTASKMDMYSVNSRTTEYELQISVCLHAIIVRLRIIRLYRRALYTARPCTPALQRQDCRAGRLLPSPLLWQTLQQHMLVSTMWTMQHKYMSRLQCAALLCKIDERLRGARLTSQRTQRCCVGLRQRRCHDASATRLADSALRGLRDALKPRC